LKYLEELELTTNYSVIESELTTAVRWQQESRVINGYRTRPREQLLYLGESAQIAAVRLMFSFNFYDEPGDDKKTTNTVEEQEEVRMIPLEDILSLLPDTLSYSFIADLPRRELWHVKMQIMQSDENEHLLGDSDVIRGSYEGGLKTWECSIDLAEYLSRQSFPDELSVLEVLSLCAWLTFLARLWFCITNSWIILSCFKREKSMEVCITGL
jgi:hypothetical protein